MFYYIASWAGDTYDFMKVFFHNMFWKEEIFEICLFKSDGNIQHQLHQVDQKFDELKMPNDQQCDFFPKTLHHDIHHELASLTNYQFKKNDTAWLKLKFENHFGKKQSKVSSFTNMLKVKQAPSQATQSYLSSVRVHCQKSSLTNLRKNVKNAW